MSETTGRGARGVPEGAGAVSAESDPSTSLLGETGPAITKVPPPPKYKNSESVSARIDADFPLPARSFKESLDRRSKAAAAGDAASLEITAAILELARGIFVLCVDENRSGLGRDAHIEAVLGRMARGEPGAVLLDAHFILTEEAHEEELELAHRRRREAQRV